ncbi:MAG: hypothetical protein H8E10_19595 [Desulfobacterales bacterium]|nr:hypothetical protein [Desulfobacterales bacterium]MBL7173417.1 hypothetical protein [Desulfobacteraceae bacterium]
MDKDVKQDIENTLASYGLKIADFDFKETDLTVENVDGIYSKAGEIIVTYKPTGISKRYQTGMLSTFPGDFDGDIRINLYKTRQ